MNILIAGDSHCDGYLDASLERAAADPHASDVFEVTTIGPCNAFQRPFHTAQPSCITFRHEIFYLEQFARRLPHLPLAGGHGPFEWYGFSGPLHMFDLFFDPKLYADRQPAVSPGLVRKLAEVRVRPWLQFLADAMKVGLQCFVIESPLLFETSPYVKQFEAIMDPRGLLALDRVARGFVKQAITKLGVTVVEIPADAVTPSGFMDERYRHPHPNDPHHGNGEFAGLMLSRVVSTLRTLGQRRGHALPPVPAVRSAEPVLSFTPAHGLHVIHVASLPAAETFIPPEIASWNTGESDGMNWLLLASRKRLDKTAVASFRLPGALAANLSGRRVRVSVLARSGSPERGTRFALSLSRTSEGETKWHWFWADREPRAGYFEDVLPAIANGEDVFVKFKANDSDAEITAPAELAAIAIEALH